MKLTSLILGLSILFISCKNDGSDKDDSVTENFYLKAKVNGQLKEFKFDAIASLPPNGNSIAGYAKETSDMPFPAISFEITEPTSIGVRRYTEPHDGMIFRLSIDGFLTYHSQHGETNDFVIDITEITSHHIKGTFNGKVFLAQATEPTYFNLTEGEFYLKRDVD